MRIYISSLLVIALLFAAGCGGGGMVDNQDRPEIVAERIVMNSDLPADEIVYMADFEYYGRGNNLYSVRLEDTPTAKAILNDLGEFPSNNNGAKNTFAAQIGTTADGTRVYCIDFFTGMMVYYDADPTSLDYGTIVNPILHVNIGGSPLKLVGQVTFGAPYQGNDWGDLFVSTNSDVIYRVNPTDGSATSMGTATYNGGTLNIQAGDLAFDDAGNFYVLTVGQQPGPDGKGLYLVEGWEGNGPWTLTASLVREIDNGATNPQYRGLAILDGGAGDWLADSDSGAPPDHIVRFGASDSEDTSYPMYLDGSLFNHGAGGDMSVGRLGQERECLLETDLIAGAGQGWDESGTDVGNVAVWQDADNFYVEMTVEEEGWLMHDAHVYFGEFPFYWDDSKRKGKWKGVNNFPAPGLFPYSWSSADGATSYTFTIPKDEVDTDDGSGTGNDGSYYIATHAVVCHEGESGNSYEGYKEEVIASVDLAAGVGVGNEYPDNGYNSGNVTAEVVGDNLVVTFTTTGDWTMTSTHVYVGTEPPTQAIPGQLGYTNDPLNDVTVDTHVIPLADIALLDLGFDDTVYIAAHAAVRRIVDWIDTDGDGVDDTPVYQSETAWGYGTPFGENHSNRWAYYFSGDLTWGWWVSEGGDGDYCETAWGLGEYDFLDYINRWGWFFEYDACVTF